MLIKNMFVYSCRELNFVKVRQNLMNEFINLSFLMTNFNASESKGRTTSVLAALNHFGRLGATVEEVGLMAFEAAKGDPAGFLEKQWRLLRRCGAPRLPSSSRAAGMKFRMRRRTSAGPVKSSCVMPG